MQSLPQNPRLSRVRHVTHIGTLDAGDKGNRGESHEGAGLSVSVHPEAWQAIARLGGMPWWKTDARGLRFLDGHALVESHAEALQQWGLEQGLAVAATAYIVGWTDADTDERCEFWLSTRDEAENELDEYMDEAEIREHATVAPTKKLLAFMNHGEERAGQITPSVLQDLATAWAHSRGLDGVWWEDRLDPESLSAPRGVVFPEQVQRLCWTQAHLPSRRRQARAG